MPQDIAKPKVGRRGHHWRTSKGRPPQYSADYQNPFGAAAKILQINSDIRLRIMLGERVSKHTIRDWRRGKDKAPAWAFDVLARESARLRAIVDQADIWLARAKKRGGRSRQLAQECAGNYPAGAFTFNPRCKISSRLASSIQ